MKGQDKQVGGGGGGGKNGRKEEGMKEGDKGI